MGDDRDAWSLPVGHVARLLDDVVSRIVTPARKLYHPDLVDMAKVLNFRMAEAQRLLKDMVHTDEDLDALRDNRDGVRLKKYVKVVGHSPEWPMTKTERFVWINMTLNRMHDLRNDYSRIRGSAPECVSYVRV